LKQSVIYWVVHMRLLSVLALASSAIALAACGGGGGGDLLSASSMRAQTRGVCPIGSSNCIPTTTTTTPPTTTIVDVDGDGIPDDVDTNGTTGSGAGGNTTDLAVGNKAVVLRSAKYDAPNAGTTALASLQENGSSTVALTTAKILSASKPTALIHSADLNSVNNSQLPTLVTQKEYAYGTRNLNWLTLRQTTFNPGTQVTGFGSATPGNLDDHFIGSAGGVEISYDGFPILNDPSGTKKVVWDRTTRSYRVATRNFDPLFDHDDNPNTVAPEFIFSTTVDTTNDYYWNQLYPLMSAKANGGTKTDYREYRALSGTDNRDELLQVWAWKNSYAVQYRNVAGFPEAKQQVWSFNGNDTTNMPTAGTATYKGRFVATAKTEGWDPPSGSELSNNNLWRVEGNSNFAVDFTNSGLKGTLTPESWQTYQKEFGEFTWFTGASGKKSIGTTATPDYDYIFDTNILIDTKIDGTKLVTDNKFTGTATLSGSYVTSENPVYGGFYGDKGTELTGVFNAYGVSPYPAGGSNGINGDRRGYLTINGAFNADCTVATAACAP
jgi:C-lobe and N-lobe beta barrels of Tf-binding protein B